MYNHQRDARARLIATAAGWPAVVLRTDTLRHTDGIDFRHPAAIPGQRSHDFRLTRTPKRRERTVRAQSGAVTPRRTLPVRISVPAEQRSVTV
jgi:hypothetical protein